MDTGLGKTSTGMDANLAAALAYAAGWVTGLAFCVLERENRFVRFHALQSSILFGALSIAWVVALAVPVVGWIAAFLILPPVTAVLWLVLMYKAYQGERCRVPVAGALADARL